MCVRVCFVCVFCDCVFVCFFFFLFVCFSLFLSCVVLSVLLYYMLFKFECYLFWYIYMWQVLLLWCDFSRVLYLLCCALFCLCVLFVCCCCLVLCVVCYVSVCVFVSLLYVCLMLRLLTRIVFCHVLVWCALNAIACSVSRVSI